MHITHHKSQHHISKFLDILPYNGLIAPTPLLPFNYTSKYLTEGITIRPFHSHNDENQDIPLFTALKAGVKSIESDVWAFSEGWSTAKTSTKSTYGVEEYELSQELFYRSDEIFSGHSESSLWPIRTLTNLYLNPLLTFLEENNDLESSEQDKNGVYHSSPQQQLSLYLDIKSEPDTIYSNLKVLIKPFIEKGYLAYYNGTSKLYVNGPLSITLGGKKPVDSVVDDEIRYVFLDAPLLTFTNQTETDQLEYWSVFSQDATSSLSNILGTNSYTKSANGDFTNEDKERISSYFKLAKSYNLKTRIWGDESLGQVWDSHFADYIAMREGLINVDDLEHASELYDSIEKI